MSAVKELLGQNGGDDHCGAMIICIAMVCIFEGPPINDYVSDDDDHHHVDHGNVTICNPFNYTRFNYDDIGMQ